MKKVLLVTAIVSAAIGGDKITGGFGLQMGDTFAPQDAISIEQTTNGEKLYAVTPPKKVKYFSQYYIQLTPKTHKIRSIWGLGSYKKREACFTDLDVLALILGKKYGELKEQGYSIDKEKFVSDGENIASLKCDGFVGGTTLYLQYRSIPLTEQARHERADLSAQTIDTDAL